MKPELERDLVRVQWAERVNVSALTGRAVAKIAPALRTALASWDTADPDRAAQRLALRRRRRDAPAGPQRQAAQDPLRHPGADPAADVRAVHLRVPGGGLPAVPGAAAAGGVRLHRARRSGCRCGCGRSARARAEPPGRKTPCPPRASTRSCSTESEMPTPLVQRPARPADPAAAGAAPGHRAAGRPGRPGAAVPDGPDPAGGLRATQYVEIPGEVLDVYRLWRPSPLFRAHRLEKALGTPARIYYKYEGVSPAGSHKPNTAVPQAFYNAKAGHPQADHRDRRRPVGHGAGVRRARSTTSSARSGRCGRRTTRSPTAGS